MCLEYWINEGWKTLSTYSTDVIANKCKFETTNICDRQKLHPRTFEQLWASTTTPTHIPPGSREPQQHCSPTSPQATASLRNCAHAHNRKQPQASATTPTPIPQSNREPLQRVHTSRHILSITFFVFLRMNISIRNMCCSGNMHAFNIYCFNALFFVASHVSA
jgi:hypothetical protein